MKVADLFILCAHVSYVFLEFEHLMNLAYDFISKANRLHFHVIICGDLDCQLDVGIRGSIAYLRNVCNLLFANWFCDLTNYDVATTLCSESPGNYRNCVEPDSHTKDFCTTHDGLEYVFVEESFTAFGSAVAATGTANPHAHASRACDTALVTGLRKSYVRDHMSEITCQSSHM